MIVNVAVNESLINKMPEGGDWKTANGQFVNKSMKLEEFAKHIQQGHAWTNPHKGYRDRKNFLEGRLIGVDIDKGALSKDDLMKSTLIAKYGAIIHTTPSHTTENPRYRVVFVLSSPIKSRHKFETVVDSIITSFETITTDKACKDAQRLFYGSLGCDMEVRELTLPLAIAVHKYAKPYIEDQERKRQEYLEKIKNHKIHYNGATPIHLINAVKNSLLEMVTTATDGQKAFQLNKAAFTAGGYVAGQYFDRNEIESMLFSAISSMPNVKDINLAERIIKKGIEKGMSQPLVITEEKDEFDLFFGG